MLQTPFEHYNDRVMGGGGGHTTLQVLFPNTDKNNKVE